MDTVQGQKKKKGCILVLSERKTRQELLFKLDNKQCASVWNTLQDNWDKLKHYIKTITCDNGVEFSTNCELSNNELIEFVRTNLYYCHPYRSGERGTNENQNKLIRRFYPKGVDLSNVTQEELNKIQDFMNNTDLNRTAIIDPNGNALYDNEVIKNVAHRRYFKESM